MTDSFDEGKFSLGQGQIQRLLKVFCRLTQLPLFLQRDPQMIVNLGKTRFQFQCPQKTWNRFLDPALSDQRDAQIGVGIREVWFELPRLFKMRNRLLDSSLSGQRDTQIILCIGIIGLEL